MSQGSAQSDSGKKDSKIVRRLKRIRPLVTAVKNTQRAAGLMVRPVFVSRYMKTHNVRKLQIGAYVCTMPGWLNTDLYPQSKPSARKFAFGGLS